MTNKKRHRFTPSIFSILYHGNSEERAVIRDNRLKKLDTSFPIVVTSYEIIMRDRRFLQASHHIIARVSHPY